MSKHLLTFILSELRSVRLVCRNTLADNTVCGTVIEGPTDRLAAIFNRTGGVCQVCGNSFAVAGTNPDGFGALAKAIKALVDAEGRVAVEFVVDAEAPPPAKP